MDDKTFSAMRMHYRMLSDEGSFAGRCAMDIPTNLEGKRVLDVCCRKGKGAYGLSDHTGEEGFVLGVDPDAGNIRVARSRAAENHWAGQRWPAYMRFSQAWPEDLSAAGVADRSYDVVYVNSIVNSFYDQALALAEFYRVLTPKGRLWVAQGVFASEEPCGLLRSCREGCFGGVFARARTIEAFKRACISAGFRAFICGDAAPVEPPDGDCAPGVRTASYVVCSVCAIA